jgi:hypothetical protein
MLPSTADMVLMIAIIMRSCVLRSEFMQFSTCAAYGACSLLSVYAFGVISIVFGLILSQPNSINVNRIALALLSDTLSAFSISSVARSGISPARSRVLINLRNQSRR